MSKSIVIDNGSYQTRIGFSGDDAPVDIYSTQQPAFLHNDQVPMKRGLINDFEAMDKVWRYGFNQAIQKNGLLDGPATDLSVIMSEHPLAPKLHTERITQHMFEQYEIPGLFIANQALLALYSCGKITGIVCDVGYEQTRFTPIYEGLAFPHAADFVNIGGKHVNESLKGLLMKQLNVGAHNGSSMDTTSDEASSNLKSPLGSLNSEFSFMSEEDFNKTFNNDVLDQIKSKLLFTTNYEYSKQLKLSTEVKNKTEQAGNAEQENSQATEGKKKKQKSTPAMVNYYKDFTLPDGKKIHIGQIERFTPMEVFFKPSAHLKGKEFEIPGIHTILYDCASQCEFDTKKEMLSSVIVCGATAANNGFSKRLNIEVQDLANTGTIVTVVESKDPSTSVWYGASVLSSLSSFQSMWIKKTDYNEYGPQIMHRRTY